MTQRKKTALLSVFYKDGIPELARALVGHGWELLSSGGTAKAISDAGLPVTTVEARTGLRAILDHRVATLDYHIHGGILADTSKPSHLADMAEYDIDTIDLVVVGLYPFMAEVANGSPFQDCIEKIDVGGPTLARGAAKNHARVGVVLDQADYHLVIDDLNANNGELSDETRLKLAVKAFATTAAYDLAVVEWLSGGEYKGLLGQKVADCDYGENRWQSPAALYAEVGNTDPLAVHRTEVVAGRSPSFINWTDVDRLTQTVTHLAAQHDVNFDEFPFVAVAVKHGNPCGASVAATPEDALKLMLTGDTRAVFGAVVMVNFAITGERAKLLLHHASDVRRLLDGICAPGFDKVALGSLGRRDGKFFLGVNPALEGLTRQSLDTADLIRPVRGGFLVQPNYYNVVDLYEANVRGDLSQQQRQDLATGIAICATSNSNTVTAVEDGQLKANAVGQQDRVGCCELLVHKAAQNGHSLDGAVAVSDSFFPFPDGPGVLIGAGIKVIFSTTGSNRDGDTQTLCEESDVTLVQLPDADARMFCRH